MAKQITGNTETTGSTINHRIEPHHIFINEIWDEDYDEEMQKYIFNFYTYGGEQYNLHLKKKDIERFFLFMRKIDAEQRWLKHIIND